MMEGAWEAGRRLAAADCEALLSRIGQGDAEAFEHFYRATDRAIYAYALSLTRNHHDAQDVMMEAYLKVRSAAHLYQPGGKPMAWVFTIVKNLVRDQQRRAGREELMGDCPEGELAIPESDRRNGRSCSSTPYPDSSTGRSPECWSGPFPRSCPGITGRWESCAPRCWNARRCDDEKRME